MKSATRIIVAVLVFAGCGGLVAAQSFDLAVAPSLRVSDAAWLVEIGHPGVMRLSFAGGDAKAALFASIDDGRHDVALDNLVEIASGSVGPGRDLVRTFEIPPYYEGFTIALRAAAIDRHGRFYLSESPWLIGLVETTDLTAP